MRNKSKKISHLLIMRLSAMGDVAMTVPVVEALRKAHPELGITMLTRTQFRPFFRNIDDIDFVDFDPKGRHKGFLGVLKLCRDIFATGIDTVADLHDVLRTKVIRTIMRLGGKKVSVIDKGRSEKKEMTRRTRKLLSPLIPMVQRYRYTIVQLGLYLPMSHIPARKVYPMPEAITAIAGPKEGAWIGVAPFAKHKGKIYPIPLMDKLISLLNEKYSRVFIFGGGSHEKSFAEGMEQRHQGVISMIGRVGISDEMDVISNLDAIVTMDSATMHIASILEVPVVSVWGATHPFLGFYGYGQDAANAVQVDMACRPCSVYGKKECIFGDYRCLSEITPEIIAAKVDSVVRGDFFLRGEK